MSCVLRGIVISALDVVGRRMVYLIDWETFFNYVCVSIKLVITWMRPAVTAWVFSDQMEMCGILCRRQFTDHTILILSPFNKVF
jgi:hypothetical protein